MPRKIATDTTLPEPKFQAATEPLAEDSALKESGFKQLTVEQLEHLMGQDPVAAERYMSLVEKLKGYKKTAADRDGIIKMSIMMLKRVQQEDEQRFYVQRACEQHGHIREDNQSALVGQRDNNHEILLVCQRCQMMYHGVGDRTGALPMRLAGTIKMEQIGGVQ